MTPPRRWQYPAAWLAAAWLAAALLLAGGAGLLLASGRELWAALVSQGVWLGLAFALARLLPSRPAETLGLGPGRLGVGALLVACVGLLAVSDGLSLILDALGLRHSGSLGEVDRMVAEAQGAGFLGALVSLGLAPGIAEELLFRGALQRPLVARFGAAAGIILAALLFGVAHLDPVHAPAAFGLGLYLGVVAQLAGSTRAAIVCHVVNNLAALLGARFGSLALPAEPAWTAPLLLGAGAGLLLGLWRWERRRQSRGVHPDLARSGAENPAGAASGEGPGPDPDPWA